MSAPVPDGNLRGQAGDPSPDRGPARQARERGAALIAAVLFAAALSIVAGAVAWFALLATQTSAAAHDRADVEGALQSALEMAAGALAREPDPAAVRRGDAVAPGNGMDVLTTADGAVDVPALSRSLASRRRQLPPPADAAIWRPYLWGCLGELLPTPLGTSRRDPLVVVWVRGDDGAGLAADRVEIAVEAIGPSGARARAVAVVRIGPRGPAIVAVWPEAGLAGPG
jgi:hypothetical protein